MKSFSSFLAEENYGQKIDRIQIFGQEHNLYVSRHARLIRDRHQESRIKLSDKRLAEVVGLGVEQKINEMGVKFAKKFDQMHDNIKEEIQHPFNDEITIYYPIESLSEMYEIEISNEYFKNKSKFKDYKEFLNKGISHKNRYNFIIVSLGTSVERQLEKDKKKAEKEKRNPNNIKEILTHGEKLRSNRQNRTWIIDNKRFYFFNNITIITSVCEGRVVQFERGERTGPQELHRKVRQVYQRTSTSLYPVEYDVVLSQKKKNITTHGRGQP
jgi:hypothetical protein